MKCNIDGRFCFGSDDGQSFPANKSNKNGDQVLLIRKFLQKTRRAYPQQYMQSGERNDGCDGAQMFQIEAIEGREKRKISNSFSLDEFAVARSIREKLKFNLPIITMSPVKMVMNARR